jgi:rubrerythrin
MAKSFSVCEIIEMGIQIEKNGYEFYTALAETVKNKAAAKVFKSLAEEELDHEGVFKKLSGKVCNYQPEGAYPDEYFSFMNAFASLYIFTKTDQGREMASKVKNFEDAIDRGIRAEKDSILFYNEMRKYVPEEDRSIIDKLIREEKRHLIKLCALQENKNT